MLITIFFKNDFTLPTMRAARFSSTRTPSTLTSVSNRSTFMTQGEACKSLKENRDGSDKVFFHVPYFGVRQLAAKSALRCCPIHISNIYAKKKGIAKKLIQTLRAIMISQDIDLLAGDFNGTAWRCRSRDNVSTIDEAFADCALPTPPGPAPLWGPGSIPDNWADVCGFLNPSRLSAFLKHGAFSIPRKAFGLRQNDQSCHHETWLHLYFVDWNNKWSNQAYNNGNIRFKERPSGSSFGTQKKRNISEVMSDHSLSS